MKASELIANSSKFVNKEYVIAWTDCLIEYANSTMEGEDFDTYIENLIKDPGAMYLTHPSNSGFRSWVSSLEEDIYWLHFETIHRSIVNDGMGMHWTPEGPIRCFEEYQELGASIQEDTVSVGLPPEVSHE